MDEKYLKILGLNKGYTEAELKKAYRKISKSTHPDLFAATVLVEEANAKMQEINEAYCELKKRFEKSSNSELEEYKRQVIAKIDYYLEGFDDVKIDSLLFWNNEAVLILFSAIANSTVATIKKSKNMDDVKKCFNRFKQSFLNFLNSIENGYDVKYSISTSSIANSANIEINYDCSIREFYKQLESLKDKYNKTKLEDLLEADINDYVTYPYYDILKKQIYELKANALNYALKKGNISIEDSRISFNFNVKNLFSEYYATVSEVEDLLKRFSTTFGADIFDRARENNGDVSIINLVNEILNIEEILRKGNYKEAKEKLIAFYQFLEKFKKENNEVSVRKLFLGVLDKYNKVCLSLDDSEKLVKANYLYQKWLEVYFKYLNGGLKIEDLEVLKYFNFIDYEEELRLLEELLNKDYGVSKELKNANCL